MQRRRGIYSRKVMSSYIQPVTRPLYSSWRLLVLLRLAGVHSAHTYHLNEIMKRSEVVALADDLSRTCTRQPHFFLVGRAFPLAVAAQSINEKRESASYERETRSFFVQFALGVLFSMSYHRSPNCFVWSIMHQVQRMLSVRRTKTFKVARVK